LLNDIFYFDHNYGTLRVFKNSEFPHQNMFIVKFLLLPFAFLYGAVTDIRNYLYNTQRKPSYQFDRFVMRVGNITAGGTGKTPFVEMLVRMLGDRYKLAILSRGYGRRTRGYRLAGQEDTASTIGDEPFQFYQKFNPKVMVAVGEERIKAIPEMLKSDSEIDIILLDDAYQHRKVRRNENILLCNYHRPFYSDAVIPAGLLRENREHANRADVVVVTKCPDTISKKEMEQIATKVRKYTSQDLPVFFSSIRYLDPVRIFGDGKFSDNVFLFTGIANAEPLKKYISSRFNLIGSRQFNDHHIFSVSDIDGLATAFNSSEIEDKCLVTTEKDMVRLLTMNYPKLKGLPIYYLPIELFFIENAEHFTSLLFERISKFEAGLDTAKP